MGVRLAGIQDLGRVIRPGDRVICRLDLNVPFVKGRTPPVIASQARIEAAKPTLMALRDMGAITTVMSHVGKPKGKVVPSMSAIPLASALSDMLGQEIPFVFSPFGCEVRTVAQGLRPKDVFMTENLRFFPGEEGADVAFARRIVRDTMAKHYVFDPLSVGHRPHASVVLIPKVIRENGGMAVAGYLLQQEMEQYDKLLRAEGPGVAVMGGAKVTDKIGTVTNLAGRDKKAFNVFIGGAMAYYFMVAKGLISPTVMPDPLGLSPEESAANVKAARQALEASDTIHVPTIDQLKMRGSGFIDVVGFGDAILSIGASRVFWNGPMGIIEDKEGRAGSAEIAETLTAISDAGALVLVGGGDTEKISEFAILPGYRSMSGGAGLEYIEKDGALPYVPALDTIEE